MQPVHDINFLDVETEKGSMFIYKPAMEKVQHWHGLIEILIRRADEEDRKTENNEELPKIDSSVADELEKLAHLKEKGILSNAEFQEQKQKLLA